MRSPSGTAKSFLNSWTPLTKDNQTDTIVIIDNKQYEKEIVEGRDSIKVTLPITFADVLKMTPADGKAAISHVNSNFPSLDVDLAGFPQDVVQRVMEARLEALVAYANSEQTSPFWWINAPPTISMTSDSGTSLIAVFMNQAEVIGKQSQEMPTVQKELSEAVINILLKKMYWPRTAPLIMDEWHKHKGSIAFSPQQQIDLYTCFLSSPDLSINECKNPLNQANSPDSPSELRNCVANWTNQLASADTLDGQMEETLVAFFSDPINKVILQTSETREELERMLNFGATGDTISKAMEHQLSQTKMPCVKTMLEAYQNAWSKVKLILRCRNALASGKLSDADSLSTLLLSPNPHNPLTPGQRLVADACTTSISLLQSQKKAAQDLLDDAERLRTLGGQNAKALQDYKDAYQLNNDPAILQKIKDINNESLGI